MGTLEIIAGNIKTSNADAVLYIANTVLPGGMSIEQDILTAVNGKQAKCSKELSSVAHLTGGQRNVFRAVGPAWNGGTDSVIQELEACFRNGLKLAEEQGSRDVDILAVPTGVYDSCLFQIATTTLQIAKAVLDGAENLQTVRILCQDAPTMMVYKQAYNFWFADVKAARMEIEGWN